MAGKDRIFDDDNDPRYKPSKEEAVKESKKRLDECDDFILLTIKKGEESTRGVSIMSHDNLVHFIHALKEMKEQCVEKL